MGRLAQARAGDLTTAVIRRFIARYGVDMSEAADSDPAAYASFNEFFTRALKPGVRPLDRKSTRLNSSHSQISYAVFCLKKKKKTRILATPYTTRPILSEMAA